MLERRPKKKDLFYPINKLEKDNDKKRIWRSKVNQELKKDYRTIFNLIDKIIFLKVPSFKHVLNGDCYKKKLKATSKGKKIMNKDQIKRFIMFYERVTKHMLRCSIKKADFVINIDDKHRLKSMKLN